MLKFMHNRKNNQYLGIIIRRIIIVAAVCLGTAILTIQPAAAKSSKPNFVFFFIDDMGYRDWGRHGNKFIETPSIDRLANESVVFSNGYVNAANCAPSRCAVLSGQYTPRTHFYNVWSIHRGEKSKNRLSLKDVVDGQVFADGKVSFAEALKKAGYSTAMYGKWHVSGHGRDGSGVDGGISPQMQGFDDVIDHSARDLDSLFKKNGDPKQMFTYTKRAMEFAEKSTQDNKPFMIYLAHHAVHTGNDVGSKPETRKYFSDKKSMGQYEEKVNYRYAAHLADTDTSIGLMLDKLEELQIKDNTVFMFLSDNGGIPTRLHQKPLRSWKGSYYEGGIRVPFFISWPKRFKPTETDVPAMAIDLYPTMLELAGVKDIESHLDGYPIDGKSLLPLLTGKSMPERAIFWHFPAYLRGDKKYTETRTPDYRQQPVSVIRKGDWKLHLFLEEWSLDGGREKIDTNNCVELYNLKQEVGEKSNLALSNKTKRDEMLEELLAWHKSINAPIPTEPNPKRDSTANP